MNIFSSVTPQLLDKATINFTCSCWLKSAIKTGKTVETSTRIAGVHALEFLDPAGANALSGQGTRGNDPPEQKPPA
jgi:hypothetical protein